MYVHIETLRSVMFAAAKEPARYAINKVLIERVGKGDTQFARCVATDGRRFAVAWYAAGNDKKSKPNLCTKDRLRPLITSRVLLPMDICKKIVSANCGLRLPVAHIGSSIIHTSDGGAFGWEQNDNGTFPPCLEVIPLKAGKHSGAWPCDPFLLHGIVESAKGLIDIIGNGKASLNRQDIGGRTRPTVFWLSSDSPFRWSCVLMPFNVVNHSEWNRKEYLGF